jgi:hypothetical protein
VDDASLRCHHQGLLHRLATPSLPVKNQAGVLWPGLMRQPTDYAWRRAVGSGTCTPWEVGPVGCDRGSSGIEGGQEEHGEGGRGTCKGRRGRAKPSCRDQVTKRGVEAGLEASMAHVRQDAASGWSLGPDMTCLPCLR